MEKKTNGYAIAGFIASFFTTIIAIILCCIGISKSKETNSGKGLAIAGLIIAIGRIVLIVIAASLFSTLVWSSIKDDITTSTYCSQAYDCVESSEEGYKVCKYVDEFDVESEITCLAN